MHQLMAATLDAVDRGDSSDSATTRVTQRVPERPQWPMIVLRTPKGWTGPKGGGWQARSKDSCARIRCRWQRWPRSPEHLKMLEEWMRSYKPEELFDENGTLDAGAGGAGADRASAGWAPIRTPTAGCC